MGEQQLEQRLAFQLAQLIDACGEAFIDEQCLATAYRMRAHHRVRQRRVVAPGRLPARQVVGRGAKALQGERLGEVMGGGQAIEHFAQRRRQGIEGRDTAGPQGVAAIGRQLLGAEHRAQRRGRQEGHVGVPHGVVTHVGDGRVEDQHLRRLWHIGVDRVDMQVAEAGGETRLLLRVERLVAEEQYLMLEQRLLDGIALFGADVAADVHAADLCAERRAEGGNGQAHVGLFNRAPGCWRGQQEFSGSARARAPACVAGRAGPSPGRRRSGR